MNKLLDDSRSVPREQLIPQSKTIDKSIYHQKHSKSKSPWVKFNRGKMHTREVEMFSSSERNPKKKLDFY